MNTRSLMPLAAACLLAGMAGCSRSHAPETTQDTHAPGYVAVARGQVAVPGGLLSVAAPLDGTVSRIGVKEGDHVREGQVLAQFDDARAHADLDTAKAELQQAQAQEKLYGLQQQAARQRAQRETAAANAGAGAGQAADEATAQVAQLGAHQAAAGAAVAVARAKLENARYALRQHTLRAPFDAYVVHVQTQKGANVSPGSGALFVLLPDRPLVVRAELNASYADAIHAGMRASIALEDTPDGGDYPAHVIRVGRILGESTLDEDPTVRATERTVECVLDFDTANHLRVGRRVLVRFLPENAKAAPKSTR